MRLGDKPAVYVEAIPTGALSLDVALGIGGIPRGRIIEIYEPKSSGKMTLAQHNAEVTPKKNTEILLKAKCRERLEGVKQYSV